MAHLAVVDGIIGGEGNGPQCPDAVSSEYCSPATTQRL